MRCRLGTVSALGISSLLLLSGGWLCSATGAESQLDVKAADGTVTVRADGREVLVYQASPNPYKVYVKSWCTPGGLSVLRDSPHDHVHHRALMYATGADGVDFWTENPADRPGKQVPVGGLTLDSSTSNGRRTATIGQQLDWQDSGGRVVMHETRRLTLDEGLLPGASLLTWDSQFSAPADRPRVELWGRHYFGLGLRMVTDMDSGGEFFNASNAAGDLVRGSERKLQAPWCAYRAAIGGQSVTVAMFDHPDNPRPATWFTMASPFAYLSATLNLDREPLSLTGQTPLHLRYGVVLWDGQKSAADIAAAKDAWIRRQIR